MDDIHDIFYFPWKNRWMASGMLLFSGNPGEPMDDTGALIFFPWKCLWKTLNFEYFFHVNSDPFSDNFAWNSSVFHRGGVRTKNGMAHC